MSNKRILWLDIVKIFACFGVIINHSLDQFFMGLISPSRPISFFFCIIQYSFARIAVPLFLMTTGVLLFEKDYKFKDVLRRIIRILIPLIIVTIIANYKIEWVESYSIKKFFEEPILAAYWYLYALVGLYLITPIAQKLIKTFEKKDFIYLFIICFIIPGIINYLEVFNIIKISHFFESTFISSLLVYSIIGVYLKKLEKNKKNRNLAWVIFLSSSFSYILLFSTSYLNNGYMISIYQDCSNLFVGLMSVSAFYLFRYYFEDKKMKLENIIVNISLTTFGVYLIHMLFQTDIIDSKFIMNIFSTNHLVAVAISELLIFSICSVCIYLIRKIPVVKKFL